MRFRSASLFCQGIDEIAKKVGGESAEVIIVSNNNSTRRVIEESEDLLYHLLVLLAEEGIPIEDVVGELKSRHKTHP
jgi:phosphoribosyl-AMP cyclohydrolase / phosphoribosyl-ATP pyrophosphohydrolase